MEITWELFKTLHDSLVCLSISAEGGWDENDPSQIERAELFARETGAMLLESFEKVLGKEWVVINMPEDE